MLLLIFLLLLHQLRIEWFYRKYNTQQFPNNLCLSRLSWKAFELSRARPGMDLKFMHEICNHIFLKYPTHKKEKKLFSSRHFCCCCCCLVSFYCCCFAFFLFTLLSFFFFFFFFVASIINNVNMVVFWLFIYQHSQCNNFTLISFFAFLVWFAVKTTGRSGNQKPIR